MKINNFYMSKSINNNTTNQITVGSDSSFVENIKTIINKIIIDDSENILNNNYHTSTLSNITFCVQKDQIDWIIDNIIHDYIVMHRVCQNTNLNFVNSKRQHSEVN